MGNKNMTDSEATTIVANVVAVMESEGFNITNEIRLKCYDIAIGEVDAGSLVDRIIYNNKSKI